MAVNMRSKNERVKTGLDVLEAEQFARLKNARVALLGHPASVNARLEHLYDLCTKNNIQIVRLFGPEHGFFGSAQDMESVADGLSPKGAVPIISLYGENKKSLMLDPAFLEGVDILVCDLQDIGSRYYTFAYTIAFALASCAAAGIKCMVLDRPNPINGIRVEGNLVKPHMKSFVGEYPLPIQHGLTVGELSRFFVNHDHLKVDLEIIWMQNWQRNSYFDETSLPWVLPSPNMPHLETALLYPGLCLIEGTNLSEGRGTTRPFELIGAPYIDNPHAFAKLASQYDLMGVTLRPCWFKPMFQKHASQMCGGVQIHIQDREKLEPLKLATALIVAARHFDGFDWRREPYEFVSDRLAIDLLYGDEKPRQMLESGQTPDEVIQYLNHDLSSFQTTRDAVLCPTYEG